MRLKSQIGKLAVIALSICSTTIFAANNTHRNLDSSQYIIVNATTVTPLSFTVNDNCSHQIGVIYEVSSKGIPNEKFKQMCNNFNKPCMIKAYRGKHCTGKPVGAVRYDNETDFTIYGYDQGISIAGGSQTIIFSS